MPHTDALIIDKHGNRHGMPDNRQRKSGSKNTIEVHISGEASLMHYESLQSSCNAVINAKGGLSGNILLHGRQVANVINHCKEDRKLMQDFKRMEDR